ncbi:hypothetical protein [Ensifer sp. B1-9]|uniref:hypothetical protein n=1 Tax=Ensifer sp. B1-9 TaxID=3141455 RepID=UPI003D1E18F4
MIAASQTVRKHARGLLATLVAILFLVAPIAEAAPIACEPHVAGSEHVISSQGKADLDGKTETGDQKACCKHVCGLCYTLFPAPTFGEVTLKSGDRRDLSPQPPIDGIISRPALGPPRSIG